MAGNVVEIVVQSKNDSAAGFDEAKAQADESAAAFEEYGAAIDRAAAAEADFAAKSAEQDDALARLNELQQSGAASADELAAAQDRLTTATLASLDAQAKLGDADLDLAAKEKIATGASEDQAAKTEESGGLMAAAGSKMKMALLGVAIGAGVAVKAAGDFQQSTTRLVTSAGESAKNLGMVQRGLLSLSSATNTSTSELASGMYTVESAGFHGAAGLTVLKAAAEGAQAEGAQLSTVANAVTSGLTAYGLSASHATSFTDQMLTAVGQGKMTMEALAGSLAAVLPVAAAAHLSFAQVGGAIATMTAQGTSANEAAQLLRHTITSLQAPNQVQIAEMQQLGVNSNDLAKNIGRNGLTGTIQELEQSILHQMGPAGMVLLKSFNQSKLAAQSAQEEIEAMPPSLQRLAQAYADGKISVQQWQQELFSGSFSANQKMLLEQFATTERAAHGFNSQLAAGGGDAQTFTNALSKVMGGAEGLQVALQVGGAHAATFDRNVKAVGDAARKGGANIQNWAMIQKQFNFQMGSAEKAAEAAGISLGSVLLPAVTAVIHPIADLLGLVAKNRAASIALAAVVGGVLAGALGNKLAGAFSGVKGMATSAGDAFTWLAAKLGITTAAQEAQTVATEEGTVAQGELDAAMDANPIGAIIMAITLLIVGIVELVKHWHDVAEAASVAFHFVMSIIDGVISWVKGHWPLLLEILAGPFGLIVAVVVKFHDQIMSVVGDVIDWIRSHWQLLVEILTGPIGIAALYIINHWNEILSGAENMIHDVVSWFERLPGMIVSAVGDLGHLLWNAGVQLLEGLLGGIESMVGSVVHAAESVGGEILGGIKGALGIGSPSKYTYQHGLWLDEGLVQGIDAGLGPVRSAAGRLAGAAMPSRYAAAGAGGTGAGAGGQLVVEIHPPAGAAVLGQEFFTALANGIRIRGGSPQVVTKKVVFA